MSSQVRRRRPSGRLDSRVFDAGTAEGEGGAAMSVTGHAGGEGPREEHASRSSRRRSKEAVGEGGRKTQGSECRFGWSWGVSPRSLTEIESGGWIWATTLNWGL
jgi:hypothetical protein